MRRSTIVATAALAVLAQAGCGTTTGNPQVSFELQGYEESRSLVARWLLPEARAAVGGIQLCIRKLRVKQDTGQSTGENTDLTLGEVTLAPASPTPLAQVTLPPGAYRRVELDLDRSCASGKSLQVQNSASGSAPFATEDRITIRFDGLFTVATGMTVSLDLGDLVTALDGVTADSQLKAAAESVSGRF